MTLADFEYQEERDEYGCPHGEVFRLQVKTVIADGVIYTGYPSDGKRCKECELKARCVSVWMGGFPRWKDGIEPDYVLEMKQAIEQSKRPVFNRLSFE